MTKRTIAGAAAALIGGIVLSSAAAAEPVKIGMITTLSGGGSSLGIDVRDGFMLAVKEEGGKLGGVDVEVLVEDDARKPDKAKQIADKFLKRDGAKILTGLIWSNLALAVVPPAVRGGAFIRVPPVAELRGLPLLAGKLEGVPDLEGADLAVFNRGLPEVEAGAFVSPRAVPAMAGAAD